MKTTSNIRRTGLTLVELLVVIAIMGLLTALIVPQVRLVNKERNIREAARVVGTALAQARDRAIANGSAGLMIERNQNLVQNSGGNDFYYGGTRLYLMRNVPNYTDNYGPNKGCMISGQGANQRFVHIRKPFRSGVIRAGDEIAFAGNPTRYRIIAPPVDNDNLVDPNTPDEDNIQWGPQTRLTIELGLSHGITNANHHYIYKRPVRNTTPWSGLNLDPPEEVAYTIFRQPRKIESSRVDLPEGYIIDLRYSGPIAPALSNGGGSGANETPTTKFSYAGDGTPVYLVFGQDGGLSQMGLNGNVGIPVSESIDLFVTEYRPEDVIGVTGVDNTAYQVLSNPAALWVTLGSQTGGVNVGYNTPPVSGGFVKNLIDSARQTSRTRTSANQ